MARKTSGRVRGLGALLGDVALNGENSGIVTLPIANVERNSAQPRRDFDEEKLAALAESIQRHGILQPLVVRKLDSGYYQIIAGERRWRAARIAGLSEIPVVITEADDRTAAELAMIENLQREDLNPMEEAAGFHMLVNRYHMTQEEAASRVGRSRSAVSNVMRLLELSPEVQDMVRACKLTAGHARALVPLSPPLQIRAANLIVDDSLSVRQTEALVKRIAAEERGETGTRKGKSTGPGEADYTAEAQRTLSSKLGRGVKIITGRKKGRIELEYYGQDDLNELLEALALLRMRKAERPE